MIVFKRSSNWPRNWCRNDQRRSGDRLRCPRGTGTRHRRCDREATSTRAVLPNAGSADQDRVVLGAAAKNLNDAFDFASAATRGIERAFRGRLSEVAADSASRERSFLGQQAAGFFFAEVRAIALPEAWKTAGALTSNLRAERSNSLFAQDCREEDARADVRCVRALGLDCAEDKALANRFFARKARSSPYAKRSKAVSHPRAHLDLVEVADSERSAKRIP